MAYKEDLLYAAFLAAVQETEHDEFSDEVEELEEQANVERHPLGLPYPVKLCYSQTWDNPYCDNP